MMRPVQIGFEPVRLWLFGAEEMDVAGQLHGLRRRDFVREEEVVELVRRDHDLKCVQRGLRRRERVEMQLRLASQLAETRRDQLADLKNEKIGFGSGEKIDAPWGGGQGRVVRSRQSGRIFFPWRRAARETPLQTSDEETLRLREPREKSERIADDRGGVKSLPALLVIQHLKSEMTAPEPES